MCDTILAMPDVTVDGAIWLGKNSDREPSEAQFVEMIPSKSYAAGESLRCSHLTLPQVSDTLKMAISRPVWSWGAEMGTNEAGLVIANEAVFTRVPVAQTGLTGLDLIRLALERCRSAADALEMITDLLQHYEQGGKAGYRNAAFRYHNSFILADTTEAWVLETAGSYWAAKRAKGIVTLSNVLGIGKDFDRLGEGTFDYARERGWCRLAQDFDFAKCFADPVFRTLTGGIARRTCTYNHLSRNKGKIDASVMISALRDHGDDGMAGTWRMEVPCAHASWWPTRHAGQTTASWISRITPSSQTHLATGTSSPCLSVFKPFHLDMQSSDLGPTPTLLADEDSLFWRHERLHRLVLQVPELAGEIHALRAPLEEKALSLFAVPSPDQAEVAGLWEEHRVALASWFETLRSRASRFGVGPSRWYWHRLNKADHLSFS
ncbi:MAG: C69 family dipeptidase [Myxococcales bacterium]|nr:C69 family dipeptidase [Myxococcales bacterium]